MVVNPERPSNPFASTAQPDFKKNPQTRKPSRPSDHPAPPEESRNRTSSIPARKPAPPIPQKPTSLHKPGHYNEDQGSSIDQDRRGRGSIAGLHQPQKGQNPDAEGPPLPPRRSENQFGTSSGLMDQDEELASSIPALEPARSGT